MIKEDLEKLLAEKEAIIAKEQKMLDAIKLLLSGFDPPALTMQIEPKYHIRPKELENLIVPRSGKNNVIGIITKVLSKKHDKWMTVKEILENSLPLWKYPVNNKKDSIKKALQIMAKKQLVMFTSVVRNEDMKFRIRIKQGDIDLVVASIIEVLDSQRGKALYPLTIYSYLNEHYIEGTNIFDLDLFMKLALEDIKETNHPRVGYKKVDNEYQYWYKTPFLD